MSLEALDDMLHEARTIADTCSDKRGCQIGLSLVLNGIIILVE